MYSWNLGTELGFNIKQSDAYTSYRSAQVWQIFDQVFTGETDRVIRVLATQSISSATTRRRLEALSDISINPSRIWPDVLAIAPYYGKNYTAADIADGLPTLAEIESISDDYIANILPAEVQAQWNEARRAGLQFVCYEGGQHFTGLTKPVLNNQDLADRFHEYWTPEYTNGELDNLTPGTQAYQDMFPIYGDYYDYMDMLRAGHVSLYVNFSFIENHGSSAMWFGILGSEDDQATIEVAPRYRAILDWREDNP